MSSFLHQREFSGESARQRFVKNTVKPQTTPPIILALFVDSVKGKILQKDRKKAAFQLAKANIAADGSAAEPREVFSLSKTAEKTDLHKILLQNSACLF